MTIPLDSPSLKLEHADARGEIYSLQLPGNRELMLLHSKKGTLRGGHSHSVGEQVMVLSGKMAYHKRDEEGGQYVRFLGSGDCSFNESGLIHMGEFLEDTWLIEWKLAPKGAWTQENYEPWRERVRASTGT